MGKKFEVIQGLGVVAWAKSHSDDEAQRLVKEFQRAVATAVVTIGTEGVDPAFMAGVLTQTALAVATDGAAAGESLIKAMVARGDLPEPQPTVDPVIAEKGGYGRLGGLIKVLDSLKEMFPAGGFQVEAGIGKAPGFPGFFDTNGPRKATDIN